MEAKEVEATEVEAKEVEATEVEAKDVEATEVEATAARRKTLHQPGAVAKLPGCAVVEPLPLELDEL